MICIAKGFTSWLAKIHYHLTSESTMGSILESRGMSEHSMNIEEPGAVEKARPKRHSQEIARNLQD